MNGKPLVSVIIPNYNHARYLDQRISTVLNQTYQNFEVIILDDCSTDNSLEIINRYKDNPHVSHIVVNDQNTGSPFKQWDKGISLAKGELVWIAESDDYSDFIFLESLVREFIANDNCVLAFVKSQKVGMFGDSLQLSSCDSTVERMKGSVFIQKYMLVGNKVENASSAVFRRKTALIVPTNYILCHGAGDYLFWIQLSEYGDVVYNHAELNKFRQHGDNVTPELYLNGTTFRELYMVFNYCRKHNMIPSLKKRLAVRYSHILWIDSVVIDRDVRHELHKIWNPYNILILYVFLVKVKKKLLSVMRK